MAPVFTSVKGQEDFYPKDWDRRARVVTALSERKMTMAELAEKLGISTTYLSFVVWGRRRPDGVETKIAEALGKEKIYLFPPLSEKRDAA
jgi:lambda repressor-like predicted transcriptional regulator